MAPGESKDERETRIARLWEILDARKEGHIDLNGLKKGFKKIDHRELSPFLTGSCAGSSQLTRSHY